MAAKRTPGSESPVPSRSLVWPGSAHGGREPKVASGSMPRTQIPPALWFLSKNEDPKTLIPETGIRFTVIDHSHIIGFLLVQWNLGNITVCYTSLSLIVDGDKVNSDSTGFRRCVPSFLYQVLLSWLVVSTSWIRLVFFSPVLYELQSHGMPQPLITFVF